MYIKTFKLKGTTALRMVFPPPRLPFTASQVWPLLLFLAIFVGVCVLLEISDTLTFANPKAFGFLIVTPWLWWMYIGGFSGLAHKRALMALFVRLGITGLFVMLLADPRAVRSSDALSIIYALDLSDSVGEDAMDRALEFINKTAMQKPEKDRAGLVVFARNAAVELPPRQAFPFKAINTRVAKDGTDIEKGLSLAAAMLPEETFGRIVLISDGTSTDGRYMTMVDELSSRGIPVDVLPIEYDYEHEVWLDKLEAPQTVKLGETYEATIILSSLQYGRGKLVLRENGEVIHEEERTFRPGKNKIPVQIYLREAGFYEYTASIELPPGRDGWEKNNIAVNHLFLRGEGKVLLVYDPNGHDADREFFVRAMKESKRVVELMSAYEFPREPMSILPYDCVVFLNVPKDAFDIMQLEAIQDAVYNEGIGFLMIGGQNSFGPGGYHRTPVEKILPVDMDIKQKKIMPKGALVIVLHTCEFPQGNSWGVRITKEAIRVLGAQDDVGVLAYDYTKDPPTSWVFPLTPASEYATLVTKINSVQAGDMPSFTPTMELGLKALQANSAAVKHMIIISDGDPSAPPPQLIQSYVNAKITVSTITIFPHGNQLPPLMANIAAATGGRHYFPKDPNLLPSIFIKEAKTLKKSMIQNKTFDPIIDFPSDILKGIDAFPQLHGYVMTSPKPRANVILKGPDNEHIDPILAVWRHGLGRTAAFTSDLTTNWARDWIEWDHYRAFVRQLITDISRVEKSSDIFVRTFATGNTGIVTVEDFHPDTEFLDVTAHVNGPRNQTKKLALKQVSPRRYRAEFPLWGKGRYQVIVGANGDERQEQAIAGFALPYSPEYLRFRSDPIALREIAERTGGRMLTSEETGEQLYIRSDKSKTTSRSVVDIFLIILACLIPLDVALRRIQIDPDVIKRWMGLKRAAADSGETMGALLRRKQEIEFDRSEQLKPEQLPPKIREQISKLPPSAKSESAEADQQPEIDESTTTGRLLARKRQWQQDKDKE
jgi:uncharacterized membrane protein